jgi:MFS family permease
VIPAQRAQFDFCTGTEVRHTVDVTTGVPDRTALGSPKAVGVVFGVSGAVMAAGVSRMPQIRDQLGTTPSALAFALVCIGIGSVLAMPFTGKLADRFGSGRVSGVAAVVALAGWASVPLAGSVPVLAAQMFFIGLGVGVWDVAMNVQGHLVEQRRGTVLMPKWHGLFSVGAVVGALAGTAAAAVHLPLAVQFPVVAAVAAVTVLIALRSFIHDAGLHPASAHEPEDLAEAASEPAPRRRLLFGRITGLEILLGIITLATALGEGAANDWLALALVDSRGTPAWVGALTYAGFNLTMAIGRFVGAGVIARYGRVPVLRVAGLLAAGGVVLLCLVNSPITALIGAGAWGFGLAVVFPSAMSAAGEIPGRGGRAIGVVSTIGYGGFLLGAPMIGFLAHTWPLDRALLAVAVIALLITVLAPAARERTRADSRR